MYIFCNSKKISIGTNFFVGLILAGIVVCRSDSGCPNEPVTPLPIPKPSPECPDVPVTPNIVQSHTDLVTPSTTVAPQVSGCGSQPGSQPVTVGSFPTNKTRPVQSNSHVNRCGGMPAVFSVSECCLQFCCQGCCSTGTEIATTPASTTAPPEHLIKCPPGTVLLGRRCHLLYCPRGSQMINDRCIVIECPEGTVWIGHSCSAPEPIVQNLKFQSTVLTQLNQTKPQVILNNTNTFFVNASLSLQLDTEYKNDCHEENRDCNEPFEGTASRSPNSNCCEIMTPRICKQYNNRWHCYSRRSRRCGEFCIAPIIYLRPSRIRATSTYLVIPPIQNDCQSYGNCGKQMGGYDCSGCAFNNMERCSYYCYRYVCPPHKCDYYDQEKYCADNMGPYGCQEEDGCIGSWCQ